MALKKLNLDSQEDWSGSILVAGTYAVGKTRLIGDFLRSESKRGKVAYANFKGEDGFATLKQMGLGDCAFDITSFDEFIEFLDECEKLKVRAIGGDSLKWLYELAKAKTTGGNRLPVTGDFKTNEYPQIQFRMHNAMTRARRAAKYVMFTCPADVSKDMTKEVESGIEGKSRMTPDLGGRMDYVCMTWFDLGGYMSADTIKDKSGNLVIQRKVSFAPSQRVLVRQRMPLTITEDITIPEGDGGWDALLEVINKAYKGGK